MDAEKTTIETVKKGNLFIHYVQFENDIDSEEYLWGLDNLLYTVRTLHQKYHFNLIHGYYVVPSGYIACLAAKLLSIPALVSIRGADIGKDIFNYKKIGMIQWTLKSAAYVTFVNDELKQFADAIYPINNKSKVIVNSALFDFNKKIESNENEDFVIGYAGDLKRKKGIIYLLDAMQELRNEKIKLLIVGPVKNAGSKKYIEYVKQKRLGRSISFANSIPHDKMYSFYNKCDAIVLPTLIDGSPNVVFEAMLMGKPIIGTKVNALTQVLKNKKDSILVDPRSSTQLKKAILELSRNPQVVKKMGQNARKKAITKCKVSDEVKQFVQIYKKLARAKK